jgi:putative cell wall-binding protein
MKKWFVSVALILFVLGSISVASATPTKTLILVSDNEADSAVAEVLEASINVEIVVTTWGEYNSSIVDQIKALNPEKVFIIGGPAAVSSEYENALVMFTTTIRVAGKDRYATAVEVCNYFKDEFKGKPAVIAHGYDKRGIKEALKEAKRIGAPVLFINEEEVPEEVGNILIEINITNTVVVPSPNMKRQKIRERLEKLALEMDEIEVDMAERAAKQIADATDAIADAEEEIAGEDIHGATVLLDRAKIHLERAQEAFDLGNYGRTFGQAVAAENVAESAERVAKRSKQIEEKRVELIEDVRDDLNDLEEDLNEAKAKGVDTSEIEQYLNEALTALTTAKGSVTEGDYGEAARYLESAKMRIAVAKVVLKKVEKKADVRGDAVEAISDVEDEILKAEAVIESAEVKGANISNANELMDRAKSSLEEARAALEKGEYERAISLARKAKLLKDESKKTAKKALELAEEAKEFKEELVEETEELGEERGPENMSR